MSNMTFSFRVRHSSSNTQQVQNLTTSIAQQFAPSQLFPPPTPQPTPPIRDATTPSNHQLATIDEVLSPRADPIKQGMGSSSPINSALFSRQNFKSQEGAHQISRQNQPTRDVANLTSRQNSQSQNVSSPISHHQNAEEPVLTPPPLPPRTYKQSKSTTATSDALPTKEISAPFRRYINPLLLRLSIITPISVQPISPIILHQAIISQLPLLHSPPTSISPIRIINPNINLNHQIINQHPIMEQQ